jgi:prepilin-type N-terminal cleavage/methylation domain-containing protein
MKKGEQGFTLIEIAIVITIIGLVLGGLFLGKNLIRAAEIRGLLEELEQLQIDMAIFENKYHGKAGDLSNATRFWGELHSNHFTCNMIASTDKRTCNGDGDGNIEARNNPFNTEVGESFRMWQHLSNAGIMNGSFTGREGALGPNHAVRGENVPSSRMENIQYMMAYHPVNYFLWFPKVRGNILFLGGVEATDANQPWRPFLTSTEAQSIDMKFDDGLAPSGKIIGQMQFVGWSECTTSNDEATAVYNTALDGIICSFYAFLAD